MKFQYRNITVVCVCGWVGVGWAERGDWCVTRGERVRERWCVLKGPGKASVQNYSSSLFTLKNKRASYFTSKINLFGKIREICNLGHANCSKLYKSEKTDGRVASSRYQEETGEVVAALHWLQAVGRLLPGQERTFLPPVVCDLW